MDDSWRLAELLLRTAADEIATGNKQLVLARLRRVAAVVKEWETK